MTPPLVFLDTETTGLSLDDDIWEVAMIHRTLDAEGNVQEQEHHLFVEHNNTKCARLPDSFRADHAARFPSHCSGRILTRAQAAHRVHRITDGAHIVGAVPNFDTERLGMLLRLYHHRPMWHYHLIDVENLAVGWLAAKGIAFPLPWRSDDLAALCGIPPVDEADRHTAMGDARWVRDWYDAIMGDHREVAE